MLIEFSKLQRKINELVIDFIDSHYKVGTKILDNEKFLTFPGSVGKHHLYKHGLLQHTYEVMQFCEFASVMNPKLNIDNLLLAALYHDYGKIFDYQINKSFELNGQEYFSTRDGKTLYKANLNIPPYYSDTEHKKLIYHISRSYYEFMKNSEGLLNEEDRMAISHMILAHHGRHEYGSPVLPQTPEAFVLHHSDSLSVFGCDPDRIKNLDEK